MARTRILIDCDPGHDDAVAILYAARHLDLLGLTTVHGNNTLERVTHNALSILALGGIDVPVAMGCATPLVAPMHPIAEAHGKTGLDGADLPAPRAQPIAQHAVDFIIETARANQGELVLAAIGPCTNVAMALKKEPRLAQWLREITVMGGSTTLGNIRAVAEFNIWCDPEAAAVVFESGAAIRMVGYNVTIATGTSEADIARLRTGGRVGTTIAGLLDFYLGRGRAAIGLQVAPMHDVCAIVPYVDETLLTYRHAHVAVETQGTHTRGMTVCDLRTLTEEGRLTRAGRPPNAQVAIASDAPRLIAGVVDTLLGYGT
jgi:inosine-uridine nucleoside N-ribohydrolase